MGLGLLTLFSGNQKHIDRTERVDKSLFRLGLDWLKYALKKDFPIQVFLLFQLPIGPVNVR